MCCIFFPSLILIPGIAHNSSNEAERIFLSDLKCFKRICFFFGPNPSI